MSEVSIVESEQKETMNEYSSEDRNPPDNDFDIDMAEYDHEYRNGTKFSNV
jgi:hypothetical protein